MFDKVRIVGTGKASIPDTGSVRVPYVIKWSVTKVHDEILISSTVTWLSKKVRGNNYSGNTGKHVKVRKVNKYN